MSVASANDIGFDIMKEEINCNYNFDSFCKPNRSPFL
jgi:hypothetical protein